MTGGHWAAEAGQQAVRAGRPVRPRRSAFAHGTPVALLLKLFLQLANTLTRDVDLAHGPLDGAHPRDSALAIVSRGPELAFRLSVSEPGTLRSNKRPWVDEIRPEFVVNAIELAIRLGARFARTPGNGIAAAHILYPRS
jgi:hypothetical protein